MKTIEEMRDCIKQKCEETKECDSRCHLYNFEGNCYEYLCNKDVIRNYNIMFGKEEKKVLNIDKYRDEINELALQYNDYTKAIITCCSKHNKGLFVDYNVAINWLFKEYKEPIKLTQFEYDLLITNGQPHHRAIRSFKTYLNMNAKGYYKSIYDWEMSIDDILSNCEIV